jgi:hypothetical protein
MTSIERHLATEIEARTANKAQPRFADHENRQPTKALRKQPHRYIRKICNFNQDLKAV